MLLVETYLAISSIEGIGVFSRGHIEGGALIWRLDLHLDRLVERTLYESLTGSPKNYLERYCYPYPRDEAYLVFEADDARYMNHCETPNCDFSSGEHGYALRDIAAGEEMTCDYRSFFKDGLEMLPVRNG